MRKLITCPVCKIDQHIYRGKVCIHQGESILTCGGSKMPVKEVLKINPRAISGRGWVKPFLFP